MIFFTPIDFSKRLKIAFHFANKIVKKLDEEIVFQFVICIVAPPRAIMVVKAR